MEQRHRQRSESSASQPSVPSQRVDWSSGNSGEAAIAAYRLVLRNFPLGWMPEMQYSYLRESFYEQLCEGAGAPKTPNRSGHTGRWRAARPGPSWGGDSQHRRRRRLRRSGAGETCGRDGGGKEWVELLTAETQIRAEPTTETAKADPVIRDFSASCSSQLLQARPSCVHGEHGKATMQRSPGSARVDHGFQRSTPSAKEMLGLGAPLVADPRDCSR